jgi:hypothetical protein
MWIPEICYIVWLVLLTFVPVSIYVMRYTLMPLLRLRARIYAKRKGINLNKMKVSMNVNRKEAKK